MVIAIDFDGTIAQHKYPEIGPALPNVFDWLKKFQSAGAKLILHTMRSDKYLEEAVKFCEANDVVFWGINNNPEQHEWTSSPKIYANLYIDDNAFGCPIENGSVDWNVVGPDVLRKINGYWDF